MRRIVLLSVSLLLCLCAVTPPELFAQRPFFFSRQRQQQRVQQPQEQIVQVPSGVQGGTQSYDVDVIADGEHVIIRTTNPAGISLVPKPDGGHTLKYGPNDVVVSREPFLDPLDPSRVNKDMVVPPVSRQARQTPTTAPRQGGTNSNPNNRDIHVLLVFGTLDAGIAPMVNISKQQMEAAFKEIASGKKVFESGKQKTKPFRPTSLTILEGRNATSQNILAKCQELDQKTGTNGAIFVYYVGHGATMSGEHVLLPEAISNNVGQEIKRRDIMSAISGNSHRFVGLVTDACSNVIAYPLEQMKVDVAGPRDPTVYIHKLSAMLLYARGVIDIGSSSEGEMARGTTDRRSIGCLFTGNFQQELLGTAIDDRTFSQSAMEGMLGSVEENVNDNYEELRNKGQVGRNDKQTIKKYQLQLQ
ncbi:MAG: hypothetical protein LBU65_13130 [Planctomycetaceae bacterium]|jgi:hypothetical protein|nr:hypothetical protein [Planctomycetaceae bacterium]